MLKPHNLIDISGVLILRCGQVVEEPAIVTEEPAMVVEEPASVMQEPALPVEDPAGAAEKSLKVLFNKTYSNETYSKDPIPNDVLKQLGRSQTPSKQFSLAEC